MEAAGRAKLGKGETAVRVKERNKNAKHIRDGLLAKQKERKQKELEEVSLVSCGTTKLTINSRPRIWGTTTLP